MLLDVIKLGSKVTITAWDHKNMNVIETTATYDGWCDHQEWGAAVFVRYDNKNCYINETDKQHYMPMSQFESNVSKVNDVPVKIYLFRETHLKGAA